MKNKVSYFLLFLISACAISKETVKISFIKAYIDTKPYARNSSLKKNNFNSGLYSDLFAKAERLSQNKIKTILDKQIKSPSSDIHDYVSRAVYLWPNKDPKNKVWESRDGEFNFKSLNETDHSNYYNMLDAIKTFSLAYYLSNDEKYAKKTIEIITTWFINPATKMNPNFRYAQAIPGINDGTPTGIIDARGILWVIDAIEIIKSSSFWDETIEEKFKMWCNSFLEWLLTSDFGKKAANIENNLGSFYDLQVIKISSYLNKLDITKKYIDDIKNKRIKKQISTDGSQPLELKRAIAHHYSIFNLSALIESALIAKQLDIDLWTFKGENSGSIENAVDFLVDKYVQKKNDFFNGKVNNKNLLRILPKANLLANGKYDKIITEIYSEDGFINLTDIYFMF